MTSPRSRLWASLEVTQRGPGPGWEGALRRAREAGGRAEVGLSGCRAHTYTLRAALGDRCENIWGYEVAPESFRPLPLRTAHSTSSCVCVCACQCVRQSARTRAPGPTGVRARMHDVPWASSPRAHADTHTQRITQTSIIYAASRSVGGNLISPQAGNLELRERGAESHRKFPQVGPAPISLI